MSLIGLGQALGRNELDVLLRQFPQVAR
jgi:hypothetical protein